MYHACFIFSISQKTICNDVINYSFKIKQRGRMQKYFLHMSLLLVLLSLFLFEK